MSLFIASNESLQFLIALNVLLHEMRVKIVKFDVFLKKTKNQNLYSDYLQSALETLSSHKTSSIPKIDHRSLT